MAARHTDDWCAVEQGSRDWRTLPCALVMWASSILVQQWYEHTGHAAGVAGAAPMLCVGTWMLAALVVACWVWRRSSRRLMRYAVVWCVLLCSASLLGGYAASVNAWWQRSDVAAVASDIQEPVRAVMRLVTAPVRASSGRGYCQAQTALTSIRIGGQSRASHARAVLFADEPTCRQLYTTGVYAVSVTVRPAEYGTVPWWLVQSTSSPADTVQRLASPSGVQRMVAAMQHGLIAACAGLPDQAKVLVPGLTLGVLGSDAVVSDETVSRTVSVDEAYAQRLNMAFRDAGIIHLMAVSGGHFALLGTLVRRGGAWVGLPRGVVEAMTALAFVALSRTMIASDSVTRALVMGLLVCGARMIGRRAQTVSALSWTVMAMLVLQPWLARSMGFALSCAAVFGIATLAEPWRRALRLWVPGPVAGALSVTLAAQWATLPLQVMMTPRLPLCSILSNMAVAPVVDAATVCGLAALVLAPVWGWGAHMLSWMAGMGTSLMERCAWWLGDARLPAVPWSGGVRGAWLMVVAQLLISAIAALLRIMTVVRWRMRGMGQGHPLRMPWYAAMAIWCKELPPMLDQAVDERDWQIALPALRRRRLVHQWHQSEEYGNTANTSRVGYRGGGVRPVSQRDVPP